MIECERCGTEYEQKFGHYCTKLGAVRGSVDWLFNELRLFNLIEFSVSRNLTDINDPIKWKLRGEDAEKAKAFIEKEWSQATELVVTIEEEEE